jgi:hypothetical protein
LKTYNSACYKATAVLVGAAAERLVLQLRDAVTARLGQLSKPKNAKLEDWRIKTVLDELDKVLSVALTAAVKAAPSDELTRLRDTFSYQWNALVHEIRASRNDVGHPSSIDPVMPEDVHATLLTFLHVSRIVKQVTDWVATAVV